MLKKEDSTRYYAGDIIKCARINAGITQKEFAQKVGWSQSFVSKIEQGMYMPDAFDWMAISDLFNFPSDSLKFGHIDRLNTISNTSEVKEEGFSLPRKYQKDRAANIRFLTPLLNTIQSYQGVEFTRSFFEHHKIDPSFKANLSHQVNLNFIEDLLGTFVNDLPKEAIYNSGKSFAQKKSHGALWPVYIENNSPLTSINKFVKNMNKYQVFWNAEIEQRAEDNIFLSIQHNPKVLSLNEAKERRSINTFFDQYWMNALHSFQNLSNNKIDITKNASYLKGDSSWKFQITTH